MFLFEYQEHFSGSENLLQASSEAVVHHTSWNIVPWHLYVLGLGGTPHIRKCSFLGVALGTLLTSRSGGVPNNQRRSL